MNRLAFSQGHELAPHGGTAVAVTPGWLRSEMMLEAFGASEDDLAGRLPAPARLRRLRVPPLRRTGGRRHGGRPRPGPVEPAVGRLRSPGPSTTGSRDVDGSQPDVWRYMDDVERGLDADPADYR